MDISISSASIDDTAATPGLVDDLVDDVSPEEAYDLGLVARVAGPSLADEVEEYFERGARVAKGAVVFDVGANVGAFAAAVVARTGPDVTLHCFEPAGPSYSTLEKCFSEHDALRTSRHELHPVALTRPELDGTEMPFYYFSRFPTDSTYDIEHKKTEFRAFFIKKAREIDASLSKIPLLGRLMGAAVKSVIGYVCHPENRFGVWLAWKVTGMRVLKCQLSSLESIVLSRGIPQIDLLKIDVEGAELDVLSGCGEAWTRIRQVAIETDERDGRADQIKRLLTRHGFRITSCAAPKVAADGDARQVLIVAKRSAA